MPLRHGYPCGILALLLLTLALLHPGDARAGERIWSGIVLASKVKKPKPAPAALARHAERIEQFFGYNQLELIGSTDKELDEASEKWLVPTTHFWMSVKPLPRSGKKAYPLQINLVHDRRPILETQAKLAPDTPLIIRGPMHASGQVLIVLQLQK